MGSRLHKGDFVRANGIGAEKRELENGNVISLDKIDWC